MTVNIIGVAGFGSIKNAAPQNIYNVNNSPSARVESISSAHTDASRAAADARLLRTYSAQHSSGARLPVPGESTLGHWIDALQTVFTSSAFKQLEQSVSGEGISITHIDPYKGILYFGGHARLTAQSAQLNDIPGARDLFDRLMTLAKRFTPYDILHLPTQIESDASGQYTVDSSIVGQFLYGPDSKAPSDHHVPADILSQTGEAETRHNLLAALKKHIETPGAKSGMESIAVEIAPHSAYWRADQPQPFTMSLTQLITAYGLEVPTTLEALANLERVLFAPSLSAPSAADYGGLLSKGVPLSEDAQKKIIETVGTWKATQTQVPLGAGGEVGSLFEYLKRAVPESLRPLADKDSEAFLKALIVTPQARALGQQLQDAIGAFPTATSGQEALLAALVLAVDPAGGLQRNNLAGYDLFQPDNKGRSSADIVKRFEAHLEGRVGPEMAKVVAYQLLAMSAPEFLVKEMPDTLVYGSLQWATFSAEVSRSEQEVSGSSIGRSYDQIRQRGVLGPVTAVQEQQSQMAVLQSLIDWGVANGVITKNSEGYSAETIEKVSAAMQKMAESMLESLKQVMAALPTRRDLALAELTKVYGEEYAHLFEKKFLQRRMGYDLVKKSPLDLYMSGELNSAWQSLDPAFPHAKVQAGISKLPDIKKVFEQAFDDHGDSFSEAAGTLFQHQVSQLPVEDRRRFEHGSVSMMHVREIPNSKFPEGSEEHPLFKHFGQGAVHIETVLNGEFVSYVYSPILGKILKNGEPIPGVPEGWHIKRRKHHSDPLYGVVVGNKNYTLRANWAAHQSVPHSKSDTLPAIGTPSERAKELARMMSHNYKAAVEELRETAKGETESEKSRRKTKVLKNFMLGLVPFYGFVTSVVKGDKHEAVVNGLFDFVSLIVPGAKGGVSAVKFGVSATNNTLRILKGVAKEGIKAGNPFGSIYDAGSGLFKLGKTAVKTLPSVKLPSLDFDRLRHVSGRSGSWNIPHGGYKQTIADGVYRPVGEDGNAVPVLASQQNGKWYALDPKTLTPYGPELTHFTPVKVKEMEGLRLDTGFAIKTVVNLKNSKDEYSDITSSPASPSQPAQVAKTEGEQKSNAA
ncbi:hypothetical protein [Pseudomonas tolaasii]|uniref:hypothetical protein n=1 Tax=Pseudomonas tolaasii TaxID=29442 RepID=UPI001C5290A6|nr:hypothetical protein [Pseudomonas tolaasii]QXQ18199.1 hypothetical protein I7845_25530 [Pseudomonas tolaasii]